MPILWLHASYDNPLAEAKNFIWVNEISTTFMQFVNDRTSKKDYLRPFHCFNARKF